MRITESQLRAIVNQEMRRSYLMEQASTAAQAAEAKNVKVAGNVVTWQDATYSYSADISTNAVQTAKLGQPLKPVAAGSKAATAIMAVAAQLKNKPAAAGGGGAPPSPDVPGRPGVDDACRIEVFVKSLPDALAAVGLAGRVGAVTAELIATERIQEATASTFSKMASSLRTAGGQGGLTGALQTAARMAGAAFTAGLSEGAIEALAGTFSALSTLINDQLRAKQKFATDCNLKIFKDAMGTAWANFVTNVQSAMKAGLQEVLNFIKNTLKSAVAAVETLLTAVGVGAIMTGMAFISFIDFLIGLAGKAANAVRTMIANALDAASRGLAKASAATAGAAAAIRPAAPAGAKTMSESRIRARRAALYESEMRKLAVEMYQFSAAHHLMDSMNRGGRRMLISSFV
jgi:hypothetical protein